MTRTLLAISSITAMLLTSGCGQKPKQSQAEVGTAAPSEVSTPAVAPGQTFANAAAAGDAFEIATSNLAIERSESSAVQAFAKQMVTAHTESTGKLKAAAASAVPALVPDATMTPDQQGELNALKTKTGADFDTAYATAQVAAHQKTFNTLRNYVSNGDVPPLKEFASGMTPIVAAHSNMAKSLKP